MASLWPCLLTLLAGVTLLRPAGGPVALKPRNQSSGYLEATSYEKRLKKLGSSSSHSLRICQLAVSDLHQGISYFSVAGYVDDELFIHYDSNTQKAEPRAFWMRKMEESNFWKQVTKDFKKMEKTFGENLKTLLDLNSKDIHTLQHIFSCTMGPDEQVRGESWKYAYDMKDLLALNLETLSWKFFGPEAESLSLKLDTPQNLYISLNKMCGELQRYLVYRKETLQRTESPTAKVTLKKDNDGQETLICHAYSFYPKEINVTWIKMTDKGDTWIKGQKLDNLTKALVLPNLDGTYHTRRSITVDPNDKTRYQCHVDHDSLPKPLVRVWQEPVSASNLWLIGIPLVLSAGVILIFCCFYLKIRQRKGANKSTPGVNSQVDRSQRPLLSPHRLSKITGRAFLSLHCETAATLALAISVLVSSYVAPQYTLV